MAPPAMNINLTSGPVLLFGGPYSNYQATLAMQREANALEIPSQNIICTGDIVAYCGDPNKTIKLIREWGIHVVMGNCEQSVGNQQDDCGCGFEENTLCATLSVEWFNYVSSKISTDNRHWMKQLPKGIEFNLSTTRFVVIHGGINNISEFIFASSDLRKKQKDIAASGVDCIVGGHCGIPFGQQTGNQFWLNSGVIGMPANDGTRDGWYLLLEQEKHGVLARWYRLSYDSSAAARSMQYAGLGSDYREALLSGIWPSMDNLPGEEKMNQGKYLELAPLLIKTGFIGDGST